MSAPPIPSAATIAKQLFDTGAIDNEQYLILTGKQSPEPEMRLSVKSGAALFDEQFAPREFIVDGLIQRGDFVLLAGRPKSGKSWLVLQIAQAIDTGADFLGKSTIKTKVLYLALEDGERRVAERLHIRKWKPENASLTFSCLSFDDDHGAAGPGLDQLFNTILENQFGLVIIDTLRKALSGKNDESDNAAMGAILYQIADFAHRHGVTIILTHHTTKGNADDPFATIRGAGAIRGAYDVGIVLQRDPKEKEAALHIESRDIDADGMTIKFDKSQGWIYEGSADALEKIRGGRRVIAAMKEMGGDNLTTTDIAKHMGISYQAVHKQLVGALDKRYVKRDIRESDKKGGKRIDVWSL
jgi:KaiC/GvpD/RAD55 family RecA-like ATPase